jgi:hypothetical protein
MNDPITWTRLRRIVGDPPLVLHVVERQFDYGDKDLQRLGRTPHDQIDSGDLWYYFHDLAHVELQPELFAHLFPVCLMDWHRTLLAGEPCSHGDSEFHYALVQGEVLSKMLNDRQRSAVEQVFFDSLLYRMDQERGAEFSNKETPAFAWVHRLNSLGLVLRDISAIWRRWWAMETPGRAVCVLKYCAELMYFCDENPWIETWPKIAAGVPAMLWANDSFVSYRGWDQPNVEFVRSFLSVDRVEEAVRFASANLKDEPEGALAARMASDLEHSADLIAARIAELPTLLASPETTWDWTV